MSRDDDDSIPLETLGMSTEGCSRRQFCAQAGIGLAVIGAAACGVGPDRVLLGGVTDPDTSGQPVPDGGVRARDLSSSQNPPPDFANGQRPPPDLSVGQPPADLSTQHPADLSTQRPPDLTQVGASCPTGLVNCGPVSTVAVGKARHFTDNRNYDLYLCRDASGIFAMDASCPHAGCTVKASSSGWHCPCHGANFDFDGSNPTSPAFSALPHFTVCIDGAGNAQVDYNTSVSPSTRY